MRAIWRQIVAVLSSNHHLTSISQKILDIQYPTYCKNPLENATQNFVSIIIGQLCTTEHIILFLFTGWVISEGFLIWSHPRIMNQICTTCPSAFHFKFNLI